MEIEQIQPEEIKARLERGESLNMIDVREPEEVALGMIPGAIHIPLGQIPERLEEIEQTGEIIMICRSGYRSERACEYMTQLGIQGLKNMEGGMLAWSQL
ncbi:sulfurtransferase [Paenibacillus selenitireducens]|jgi:rhodanese-related sulfurtransferase|uniref:Sulfurtransferase n=1 Tax=Paenibacillus selenitireducens TaxID=1324314 RepID=A0A1T2XFC5_9BACL|nr:rhodanese-like domain-containing protein [Paenibacillus selenitireducens]OPA78535.1 sulfurtransferase [Paenibacillus selenitireducens]